MESETATEIRALDAAYKPFPGFKDWSAGTVVDSVRWNRYKTELETRSSNLSSAALERARNVAKRAAAIDTGAIEGLYEADRGFTFTVAYEAAAWEAALAQKGEHARPLFEAQLRAYDYVLDLATKAEPISEAAIRRLHEVVCEAQQTYRVITAIGPQEQALPKGQYKALPNHVRTRKGTNHSYAPVDVTPAEMARFVRELRRDEFLSAHPVSQAAYAHYCLVAIHPFSDGNGRVARALASAFTYRDVSMPIVILTEQKDAYLTALEAADRGEHQQFLDFMLARSLDTIVLVTDSLRAADIPSADESASAIRKLYLTKGGYTHDQVDEAGLRLLQAFQNTVGRTIGRLQLSKVSFTLGNMSQSLRPPGGYRTQISGANIINLSVVSAPPATAQIVRFYSLLLPIDAAGDDDVQLIRVSLNPTRGDPNDAFTCRLEELMPTLSGMLQVRINLFAERVVSEMLAALEQAARNKLGSP